MQPQIPHHEIDFGFTAAEVDQMSKESAVPLTAGTSDQKGWVVSAAVCTRDRLTRENTRVVLENLAV